MADSVQFQADDSRAGFQNDFFRGQDEDGMIMGHGQGNSNVPKNFSQKIKGQPGNLIGGLSGDHGENADSDDMIDE